MTDKVYKVTEIVGTSSQGVDEAVRGAVARAAHTLRGIEWFEVKEIRGHVENNQVAHVQVTLKLGFALEDH